jgi:ubiquinone biosynthesis protein
VVFGMVAAATLRGVVELASGDANRRAWQLPLAGAGVGTAGTLAAYLGWSSLRRSSPKVPAKLRRPPRR